MFQEDNDPKHTLKVVVVYFQVSTWVEKQQNMSQGVCILLTVCTPKKIQNNFKLVHSVLDFLKPLKVHSAQSLHPGKRAVHRND